MKPLDHALRLARKGHRVAPIGENLIPLIAWKASASSDPKAVRDMPWRRAWLVGVICGERFCVLDIDPRHGGDTWLARERRRLPPTREHCTRSGGVHLLFRAAPGLRNRDVAPGVEVKGEGTLLRWWPSRGLPVANPDVLAPMPQWLVELAAPPVREPIECGPVKHPDRYVDAALRRAAETVAGAPAGQRNMTLNREAWSLARLDVTAKQVRAALLPAALHAGIERKEAEDTLASALQRTAA